MSYINNPALYRKMSEPFTSADVAQLAWEAFRADLFIIREKHKITDVFVGAQFSYVTESGSEAIAGGSIGLGDSMRHEVILASALNSVQRDRQEMIGEIISKGVLKVNR